MHDGLTQADVQQIQADAAKAVARQFRDATEDSGWTPTEWHPKEDLGNMAEDKTAPAQLSKGFTDGGSADTSSTQPSEAELALQKQLDEANAAKAAAEKAQKDAEKRAAVADKAAKAAATNTATTNNSEGGNQ